MLCIALVSYHWLSFIGEGQSTTWQHNVKHDRKCFEEEWKRDTEQQKIFECIQHLSESHRMNNNLQLTFWALYCEGAGLAKIYIWWSMFHFWEGFIDQKPRILLRPPCPPCSFQHFYKWPKTTQRHFPLSQTRYSGKRVRFPHPNHHLCVWLLQPHY